jgi:hypothetical protein
VANNVTAIFSEPVATATIIGASANPPVAGTISLRLGTATTGALVAAVVTYNAASRLVTINPTTNLATDARYTVRFSNGIKDVAGNALAPVSWTFLTGTAPTVIGRTPMAGATAVAVTGNVTATLSEGIAGFTSTSATVRAGTAAPVAAAVTFVAATRVLTINPTASLAADTLYLVTLTGGGASTAIHDIAGNPLATVTWTFMTGPGPTISARTPAADAASVLRTRNITATISEPVRPITVNGTTANVRNALTGVVIPAVVSYNSTTRLLTINPNTTLAANTLFTVRLASGILDAAGNALPATTWNFRTGVAM